MKKNHSCQAMSNAALNKRFLSEVDAKTRDTVLANIAGHYGITADAAQAEVTHDDAEHLLDYLTGPVRGATSVLMRRQCLSAS